MTLGARLMHYCNTEAAVTLLNLTLSAAAML